MAVTQYGFHETLVNRFETTLNGSTTAVATSITLTSVTGLPTEGFFYLLINSEIIRCHGVSGSAVLVSERGAEGTTAASHSDTDAVQCVMTNESLQRYLNSNQLGCSVYSQQGTPTVDPAGYPVPVGRMADENRANIAESGMTWHNQGGVATATDSAGGIVLTVPDEANHKLRGKHVTIPTAPYMVTARFRFVIAPGEPLGTASTHGGIWILDSSDRILSLTMRAGGDIAMFEWSDAATYSATVDTSLGLHFSNWAWLRIYDDNTNHRGYFSLDGQNWSHHGTDWWTQSRTAHLTSGGNRVGFYLNSANGGNFSTGPATTTMVVDSFHLEEL